VAPRARLWRRLSDMGTRGFICPLAATLCLAIGSTPALASSGDATSTQAYVQAGYAALRVAISNLARSEAGPLHVLATVQHECPQVGANSPQDDESTQMSNEVIGAMVVSAIAPDLPTIRTFVHAVAGLRWSNGALTRSIHAYTSDWNTLASLSAPNLCGDIKAWDVNGFHSLPASTVTFVAKFMPAWVAPGFLPARLTRYESSATRALVARCNRFEEQITELEAREVAHYNEIMNALAIWP
jgi:hypothetical protein